MGKKPQTVTIKQPTYYRQFSCIGPACTDNCCHDWIVTIDKKHYLQYLAVPDAAFHEKCKRAIQRNKKSDDPAMYAFMQLDAGRCLFQDPDGGCGIFRLLGEDALSDTCTVYPRLRVAIDETHWECSLTLSCEEAARLALLTGKPLEFEEFTYTIDPANRLLGSKPAEYVSQKIAPWNELSAVRAASMEIMQQHGRPLTERLLSIGLALRTADRYLQEGKAERIPMLMRECAAQSAAGALLQGFFERLPEDVTAQRWAMLLPTKHLLSTGRIKERAELFMALAQHCEIKADGKATIGEKTLDHVAQCAREAGDPFLARNAQAVENYLVNYIFSSFFPFPYLRYSHSLAHCAVVLTEQYAMLRILAGVMPPREGESEGQRLVRLVTLLAHITQHSNLLRDIQEYAKQKEDLDTLAYAAYMLR